GVEGWDVRVGVTEERHGHVVAAERAQDEPGGTERPRREDERGGLVRLLAPRVRVACDHPYGPVLLGEALDQPAREVGEVRLAFELVERPLRPVDAALLVGPVAEVEIAMRPPSAMHRRADREARAAEEEPVPVERLPTAGVALEDDLGAGVDLE